MLQPARIALVTLAVLLLAGCRSSPPPVYRSETFDAESPFVSWSTREPAVACEIGRRALLSQGYKVDSSNPTSIRGEKYFQPKADYGMRLDIVLVCLPSNVGAAIYASALQTSYEMKSAASSAGVGVAGVGSISLPWSSNKEAFVKVGEETVSNPDFYRRLFALIDAMQG